MYKNFLKKDVAGNWNTDPALTAEEMRNVNCHKFVLYVVGLISRDELVFNSKDADFTYGKKIGRISGKEFVPIANVKELREFAEKECESDEVYVGQIVDAKTGEMAHSFIVEKDSEGRFYCFDKAGFKFPFSVYEIEDLFKFENYHDQKWRFIPISRLPTLSAWKLAEALEKRGIETKLEYYDGHKHVDIYIPEDGMYIEVEGLQHFTDPHQIIKDLKRDYYSDMKDHFTFRVTNQLVQTHLEQIADAIKNVVKDM